MSIIHRQYQAIYGDQYYVEKGSPTGPWSMCIGFSPYWSATYNYPVPKAPYLYHCRKTRRWVYVKYWMQRNDPPAEWFNTLGEALTTLRLRGDAPPAGTKVVPPLEVPPSL